MLLHKCFSNSHTTHTDTLKFLSRYNNRNLPFCGIWLLNVRDRKIWVSVCWVLAPCASCLCVCCCFGVSRVSQRQGLSWERWRRTTRMWRWRIGMWRRTAWSPRGGETRRPARRTVRTWQSSGGSCSPSWSFPSFLSSFFGLYTIPILTLETISRRWTRDSSAFNEVLWSEPACCK